MNHRINGIKTILSSTKYTTIFSFLVVVFAIIYIFEWNLILFPDIYVRADLWTFENIVFLSLISILSSLAVTLGIFNMRNKISAYRETAGKESIGLLSFVPALFTSACPGCAPLILSFTSTTFAIGLSLAQFGTIIKLASIALLSVSIYFLSSSIGKCKIGLGNKGQLYVDQITKIFLIVFIIVVSYLVLSVAITPLFAQQPRTMYEMMQQVMNLSQQTVIPNILALVIGLGIGLFASLQLKTKTALVTRTKNSKQHALFIVKKKLSDDEKQVLKEIERTGAITQDSLRARLGWSKAKVSTTLTRLDRMNLIQRERQGKTYKVFLSKDLR